MKEIDLTQKRDFGGVLNASFEFAKQEFGMFFKTMMTYTAIPLVALLVLAAYIGMQLDKGQFQSLITSPDPSLILSLVVPGIVAYLLFIVLGVMVTAICYAYLTSYKKAGKGNFTVADIGQQVARKFFPIIGYSIVLSFVVGAGLVLLILPGIYLAICLSLIFMIMFYEDKGLSTNFNRCFSLIKNNWWVTFALIIIASIIVFFVRYLLGLPFQIFIRTGSLWMPQNTDISQLNIPLITFFAIVMMLGSMYLQSFVHLVVGMQYFNLNAQTSTESIEDRINKIGDRSGEDSL